MINTEEGDPLGDVIASDDGRIRSDRDDVVPSKLYIPTVPNNLDDNVFFYYKTATVPLEKTKHALQSAKSITIDDWIGWWSLGHLLTNDHTIDNVERSHLAQRQAALGAESDGGQNNSERVNLEQGRAVQRAEQDVPERNAEGGGPGRLGQRVDVRERERHVKWPNIERVHLSRKLLRSVIDPLVKRTLNRDTPDPSETGIQQLNQVIAAMRLLQPTHLSFELFCDSWMDFPCRWIQRDRQFSNIKDLFRIECTNLAVKVINACRWPLIKVEMETADGAHLPAFHGVPLHVYTLPTCDEFWLLERDVWRRGQERPGRVTIPTPKKGRVRAQGRPFEPRNVYVIKGMREERELEGRNFTFSTRLGADSPIYQDDRDTVYVVPGTDDVPVNMSTLLYYGDDISEADEDETEPGETFAGEIETAETATHETGGDESRPDVDMETDEEPTETDDVEMDDVPDYPDVCVQGSPDPSEYYGDPSTYDGRDDYAVPEYDGTFSFIELFPCQSLPRLPPPLPLEKVIHFPQYLPHDSCQEWVTAEQKVQLDFVFNHANRPPTTGGSAGLPMGGASTSRHSAAAVPAATPVPSPLPSSSNLMDQSREAYTYKAPDSNSQWTARPSTTASSTLPRPAAPASSNSSVMDKLQGYAYKAPESGRTVRPSTTAAPASSTLLRPAAPASSNSSVMDKLQGYAYKAPESGRTVRAPASRLDLDHSHPDELQTLKVSVTRAMRDLVGLVSMKDKGRSRYTFTYKDVVPDHCPDGQVDHDAEELTVYYRPMWNDVHHPDTHRYFHAAEKLVRSRSGNWNSAWDPHVTAMIHSYFAIMSRNTSERSIRDQQCKKAQDGVRRKVRELRQGFNGSIFARCREAARIKAVIDDDSFIPVFVKKTDSNRSYLLGEPEQRPDSTANYLTDDGADKQLNGLTDKQLSNLFDVWATRHQEFFTKTGKQGDVDPDKHHARIELAWPSGEASYYSMLYDAYMAFDHASQQRRSGFQRWRGDLHFTAPCNRWWHEGPETVEYPFMVPPDSSIMARKQQDPELDEDRPSIHDLVKSDDALSLAHQMVTFRQDYFVPLKLISRARNGRKTFVPWS